MSRARIATQFDLFASEASQGGTPAEAFEPPPEDFIQRLRDELNATLALAQGAPRFPWRDLTQTMITEMRFHSIAVIWMPAAEATGLRAAFDAEMARLYAVHDAALPPEEL